MISVLHGGISRPRYGETSWNQIVLLDIVFKIVTYKELLLFFYCERREPLTGKNIGEFDLSFVTSAS